MKCEQCNSELTYEVNGVWNCMECGHEWSPNSEENHRKHFDANGNILEDGDTVVIIKDLKVKGSSTPIKQGTKIKGIRLLDKDDHDIDCKIEGHGAMLITSKFVKKV